MLEVITMTDIRFDNYKLTKSDTGVYKIPEHSLESFELSLTKIIKASSITQQELGKAMKITNTTIHNYMMGYRKNPTKDFMIRMADYFDIKPSYFREYRIRLLMDRFEMFPELIDIFLDLSTNPQRIKKIINEWIKRNQFEDLE